MTGEQLLPVEQADRAFAADIYRRFRYGATDCVNDAIRNGIIAGARDHDPVVQEAARFRLASTPTALPGAEDGALREAIARELAKHLASGVSGTGGDMDDCDHFDSKHPMHRQAYFDAADALLPLIPRASDEVPANPVGEGLVEALEWFSNQRRFELSFYAPVYGDDDDQSEEWRVHRQGGSINDREWDLIARGNTASEAIIAAYASASSQEQGASGEVAK